MGRMRYNRAFKGGMAAIVFCLMLFGSVIAFFVVSRIQYARLVSGMESLEATVVDVDYDVHVKGPDEQEIYIEYVVDGVTYRRELKTDTTISFNAGTGAHYSVGDRVPILYDPQNPERIASPRSVAVGYFWMILSSAFFALVFFIFCYMIKKRRTFLVTQREYEREGAELKKVKLQAKKRKKRIKAERKKRHPVARKVKKILLIILASLVGVVVLFFAFGLLLIELGY